MYEAPLSMNEASLSERLSSLAGGAVPPAVLEEAAAMVFAVVSLAREPDTADRGPRLAEALRALAGEGEATVIGAAVRLPAPWAALANAASAARAAAGGPTGPRAPHHAIPVVAAAIAAAETVGASGAGLLAAVAVGTEVSTRLHDGLGRSVSAKGWDATAALGGLGAAVAAGRLLGLGQASLAAAIGIASTRAAGLRSAVGTDVAAFQVGKAAADGVEAAQMAGRGFTAPPLSIEGRRGLGHLLADDPPYLTIIARLGDAWRIGQAGPRADADRLPASRHGGSATLGDACRSLLDAGDLRELLAAATAPDAA
jgi:2-methylcitrate dehydratase PrpD